MTLLAVDAQIVIKNAKLMTSPPSHLNARGFFARLEHPEVGVQTHTGMPWRLSNAPNGVQAPAPLIGNDTNYVMQDLLGYSVEEIAQLKILY